MAASFTNVTIEQGQSIEYVIPEFPTFLILMLFITVTLLAVIVCKGKRICINRGAH